MATKENGKSATFNLIAERWYHLHHWTRFRKELSELADRWQCGRLLNVGCAHGPDFLPFKDRFDLYGIDSSERMIEMAVRYESKFNFQAQLLTADAVHLPFADRSFDWVIAVAVYHHIEGKEDRSHAFRELRRVLKVGGEAFITVWNRWQRRFFFSGKQVVVPWKTKSGMLPRYHYLYSYREIEKILEDQGFTLVDSYPESAYRLPIKYFSRNICVLVKSN